MQGYVHIRPGTLWSDQLKTAKMLWYVWSICGSWNSPVTVHGVHCWYMVTPDHVMHLRRKGLLQWKSEHMTSKKYMQNFFKCAWVNSIWSRSRTPPPLLTQLTTDLSCIREVNAVHFDNSDCYPDWSQEYLAMAVLLHLQEISLTAVIILVHVPKNACVHQKYDPHQLV